MFSVIIPVHNSEKTLKRCLDSLACQTYRNFEALLIENGSTDNSLSICHDYENKDSRFKTFDIGKCNGPSKARNYGLDMAKGDYIAFVDSDDWIENNHLELIADSLTKADIVFLGYGLDDEDENTIKTVSPEISAIDKKAQCYELIKKECFGFTWRVSFRAKKHQGIRFPESINLFEDLVFTTRLLETDDSIIVIPNTTYHYVQDNLEAITKSIHKDMIFKKNEQFKAHRLLLGEDYSGYLLGFANDCVSFCVNYAFENHFKICKTYKELKKTDFYSYAKTNPNKWVKTLSRGYAVFLWKYIIYKIKCSAYNFIH